MGLQSFQNAIRTYTIFSVTENYWAREFSNQFSDRDSNTVMLSACDILNLPLAGTVPSSRPRNKILLT